MAEGDNSHRREHWGLGVISFGGKEYPIVAGDTQMYVPVGVRTPAGGDNTDGWLVQNKRYVIFWEKGDHQGIFQTALESEYSRTAKNRVIIAELTTPKEDEDYVEGNEIQLEVKADGQPSELTATSLLWKGSAAIPSYSFTGDPNTGMYSSTADQIHFSAGGTQRFEISSSGIEVWGKVYGQQGAADGPTYSFIAGTTMGMYYKSSDHLGFATGGAERLEVSNAGITVAGTTESTAYTIGGTTLAEYIADTVGAMVTSNTETRITVTYEDGDNTLDFVVDDMTGGTNTTLHTFSTAIGSGSVPTSSYGIFRYDFDGGGASQDTLAFASGQTVATPATGTDRSAFWTMVSTTNILIFEPIVDFHSSGKNKAWIGYNNPLYGIKSFSLNAGDGTAAEPSHTFYDDVNTGMYRDADDTLAFTVGGEAFNIKTAIQSSDSAHYMGIYPNNEGDGNASAGSAGRPWINFGTYPTTSTGWNYKHFNAMVAYYLQSGDGTTTFPGFAFKDDPNTGFYRIASGNIGITGDGTQRGQFGFHSTTIAPSSGSTTAYISFSVLGDYGLWGASGPSYFNHIRPATNDLYDVGSSTLRWDDVYATNGTINTSDIRLKEDIKTTDLGLGFINDLNPVSYKWKKKQEDKLDQTHYGIIAQEVMETLKKYGVNSVEEFGGITHDGKEEDYYGARYGEFVPILIKAVQELSAEIKELKEKN